MILRKRSWSQIDDKKVNNPIDLRIKKSGKNEKISVKVGHFSSKKRREFEVELKEGEMVNALRLFEALEFRTGMIYFWKSFVYKHKEFEIKINEYPNGYRDWEIESLTQKSDPNELAKELSLKPFGFEDFRKDVSWRNKNLDDIYSLEKVLKLLKKIKS